MRVAGLQMAVSDGDIGRNCTKICSGIRQAAAGGADVLLTPEGSLSGYHDRFDPREAGEALSEVAGLARQLRVGLALGTCFWEEDGHCYNQMRFYDRQGAFLGFHAKILLCSDRLDEPYAGEIMRFATAPLRVFRLEGVTVGGLICNDMWANPGCTPMPDPHLTQSLARLGARVVFHTVNGGRGEQPSIDLHRAYHQSNQRLRAIAGGLYIVTVDNAHPVEKENSCAGGVIGPDGGYLCQLPLRGEGLFIQDIAL